MRHCSKLELALALAGVLSATAFQAPASAQGFNADRASNEGPGFKAGRLVLHPGLSLEGGYDSNVFLENTNEEDSFLLRLEGYLDVATGGSQRQSQGESNEAEPQKIAVELGLSDGLNVEIVSGLGEGDEVVQRPPREIS